MNLYTDWLEELGDLAEKEPVEEKKGKKKGKKKRKAEEEQHAGSSEPQTPSKSTFCIGISVI